MMTSSNGNIFRVTGHLCGELTGHRWIPHKGQWRGALVFSLIYAWINGWVNNREPGDWRRHRVHNDVAVIWKKLSATTSLVFSSQALCKQTDLVFSPLRHEFYVSLLFVLWYNYITGWKLYSSWYSSFSSPKLVAKWWTLSYNPKSTISVWLRIGGRYFTIVYYHMYIYNSPTQKYFVQLCVYIISSDKQLL